MSYAISAACGRSITAGACHTHCCTFEDRVASWGNGKNSGNPSQGGLLASQSKDRLRNATIIDSIGFPKNPVQVSGGAKHSAILLQIVREQQEGVYIQPERQVYTWGDGAQGRLGHGVDEELTEENEFPTATEETIPRQVLGLEKLKIVTVVCGGAHTMALHDNGIIYSWGCGANGRLGHGDEEDIYEPKMVEQIKDLGRMIMIDAGGASSAASNNDGVGFTWGCGANGRLGSGSGEDVLTPTAIAMTQKEELYVGMFSMGGEHGAFIDGSGSVYTFGSGADGKLGHGNLQDQQAPKRIEFFDSILPVLITNVAAGGRHTVYMTDEGDIYTCGYGGNGRLGQGTLGDIRIPMLVRALDAPEYNIVAIAAGDSHSAVIVQTGDVYCFGWGQFGQLGTGNFKDQLLPVAVPGLSARCPR